MSPDKSKVTEKAPIKKLSPNVTAKTDLAEAELIPVNKLHFDHDNPRLSEFGITLSTSEEKILKTLWDTMDVRELVQSISASGFFKHEPIIVTREGAKAADEFIVIEGNRRLAAVKVLLHESIGEKNNWPIPHISDEARKKLSSLPAIISTRKESWRYLGFKHVNGPAKWSSFAKAQYIASVHKEYKIPLTDIAEQIGDRHRTVQRLYRGLMVLNQAQKSRVFNLDERQNSRFAFSHLYTGIDYDGISAFIGLTTEDDESETPVPDDKISQLGELCTWLYGNKKEQTQPAIASQNPDIRRLNIVLKSKEATAALRAGNTLEKSYEISKPPTQVLEDALLAAKRDLLLARTYITTGHDKSVELLKLAGTVAELADDIYTEMERKIAPPQQRVRMTED